MINSKDYKFVLLIYLFLVLKQLQNTLISFEVFSDTSPLPRYKYHRSLLDWFMEGTVQNSLLHECPFKDCDIIIGGNVSDKIKLQLFGSKAPITNVTFSDLRKGKNV